MTVLQLPLRTDLPHYSFSMELDGVAFVLEWRWNARAGFWFFSLLDAEGTPLVVGRKVVPDFPLLARFRDPRLPRGLLMVQDTTGKGTPPGVNELGSRVVVLYADVAELRG